MPYLFTSESVSEGHPDKVSDQISDAILDAFLSQDPYSRVACETLCTTGLVVVAGEVSSNAYIDIDTIVRETINEIGYDHSKYKFDGNSCAIIQTIHQQSPDIARGVDEVGNKDQGAGDQGMMFGYATKETPEYLPSALAYAHRLVHELANIRKENRHKSEADQIMGYLRPDAKSQVTIEFAEDGRPLRVHTLVVSTQHEEFDKSETLMQQKIREDVLNILIPRVVPSELIDKNTIFHINPTGKFVIGGPHGDSGLTGRKIIVDTYGGKGAHGGGAFSGKDPSKVDRSAAYAARHIARNLVAAGVADECLIQVSYAIGVARPLSIFVNTYGTSKVKQSDGEIANIVGEIFDMRPKAIIERLGLLKPIYKPTAAYGHMGRNCYDAPVETRYVEVSHQGDTHSEIRTKRIENVKFFSWEEENYVQALRDAFKLS
jgi:S-adenosylmethionine synthetase